MIFKVVTDFLLLTVVVKVKVVQAGIDSMIKAFLGRYFIGLLSFIINTGIA